MATYPNDATLSVTAFSVIGESTFTDTGPNTTNFALPSTVSHRGEIAAFIDGVLQATTSYELADSGATASFLTAPNASVLVLKTISLPPRFRANRTFPAVRAVDFNATSAVVINSVSYLINGSRTAFAFPEGVTVTAKSEFLVFVSGVQQQESAFTFPSSSLGNAGIDIDDDGSALDAPDTLSIRVFDSSVTSFDRFTSMADRKPDNGVSSQRSFDSITFTSQSGYEKRRLRSRRSKRQYSLQYTNVTGVEKSAIESFYNERSGEFESFVFDLSHINDSGTINARFSGTLKVAQVLSNGAGLLDNFYTVSFELQETFD
jgi:hypothetical protein